MASVMHYLGVGSAQCGLPAPTGLCMKMPEIMHENCSYPHLQGVCQCIACTFQGFVNASERGVILRQLIDVGGCWHEAPSACRDWNARGTNTFSRTYQFFIVTQNTPRLALLTSSSLPSTPIYPHLPLFSPPSHVDRSPRSPAL